MQFLCMYIYYQELHFLLSFFLRLCLDVWILLDNSTTFGYHHTDWIQSQILDILQLLKKRSRQELIVVYCSDESKSKIPSVSWEYYTIPEVENKRKLLTKHHLPTLHNPGMILSKLGMFMYIELSDFTSVTNVTLSFTEHSILASAWKRRFRSYSLVCV